MGPCVSVISDLPPPQCDSPAEVWVSPVILSDSVAGGPSEGRTEGCALRATWDRVAGPFLPGTQLLVVSMGLGTGQRSGLCIDEDDLGLRSRGLRLLFTRIR